MPLLVIPYKDANGLIQACQIRLHANDISFNEKRYCWLSSPLERHGTSSGTPIHFTFVKEKLLPGETVLITEGALKVDTVVRFRPNARVIANPPNTCAMRPVILGAGISGLHLVLRTRHSQRFQSQGLARISLFNSRLGGARSSGHKHHSLITS